VPDAKVRQWEDIKERGWIPSQTKDSPSHEPCNGLLMCSIHHYYFDRYQFFVRFVPRVRLIPFCFRVECSTKKQTGKFVFVNYSNRHQLQQFHGKAIALDIHDRHVPFPSLFIIHEMRVREFHPFQPITPDIPIETPWQDWLLSGHVINASGSLIRDRPPIGSGYTAPAQLQGPMMGAGSASSNSGGHPLALNQGVIDEILAATRGSASWKACEMEGTSSEENIEKHISTMGVEGSSSL